MRAHTLVICEGLKGVCVFVCARACVHVHTCLYRGCVCACVCVRACVRACVRVHAPVRAQKFACILDLGFRVWGLWCVEVFAYKYSRAPLELVVLHPNPPHLRVVFKGLGFRV